MKAARLFCGEINPFARDVIPAGAVAFLAPKFLVLVLHFARAEVYEAFDGIIDRGASQIRVLGGKCVEFYADPLLSFPGYGILSDHVGEELQNNRGGIA